MELRTDNKGWLYVAGVNEYFIRYMFPNGGVIHKAYLQTWIAGFGEKADLAKSLRPSDVYEVMIMCRENVVDTIKGSKLVLPRSTSEVQLLARPCKKCRRLW